MSVHMPCHRCGIHTFGFGYNVCRPCAMAGHINTLAKDCPKCQQDEHEAKLRIIIEKEKS